MTQPPLDNAPMHGRRLAGAIWLAFIALLGNVLLPAALSIIVLKEPGRAIPGMGICGQWPDDAPGKSKLVLLVQHCPLCTVSAAPLPQSSGFAAPGEVADESQLQLLTSVSLTTIRHGRMQARAPPSAV